jgi:hypothetical protein
MQHTTHNGHHAATLPSAHNIHTTIFAPPCNKSHHQNRHRRNPATRLKSRPCVGHFLDPSHGPTSTQSGPTSPQSGPAQKIWEQTSCPWSQSDVFGPKTCWHTQPGPKLHTIRPKGVKLSGSIWPNASVCLKNIQVQTGPPRVPSGPQTLRSMRHLSTIHTACMSQTACSSNGNRVPCSNP